MSKTAKLVTGLLLLALSVSFLSSWTSTLQAQSTVPTDILGIGVAKTITLANEEIPGGSVVSFKNGEFVLSSESFDPDLFGVIPQVPAVVFEYQSQEENLNEYPVITSGTTAVRVTNQNGDIRVGDRLTTSDTPGVAMLADKSGITIGVAQEAYDSAAEGSILVTVDVKFALSRALTDRARVQDRLLDVANLSAIAALEDPQEVFKYVLAGFILVGSVAFAFLTFGRSAQNSILALGRNPLASRAISAGMVINILMSIVIITSGVLVAWFVIRL